MYSLSWLILLLPMAGFLGLSWFGKRFPKLLGGWFACAMVGGAFLVTLLMLAQLYSESPADRLNHVQTLYPWVVSEGFSLNLSILIDPLSVFMLLIVTGVGALIHVYSIGYMHHDKEFNRFFAYMNLFIFAMSLLVLVADFFFLIVGWALVGLASYLLIGFWTEKKSAVLAARKAFVMNVIGDVGMVIAAFMIFEHFGSLNYVDVFKAAPTAFFPNDDTVLLITFLLLVGAFAKSAQIPLHTWLPDAMEGPTPVSALIHAATMVTAGVYLVARCNALFTMAPFTMYLIASVGVITALFAGSIGMVQYDIKRVIAYSTMSQIGFMFLAVGVGVFSVGMFHLMTHAFFKALLFLGAGSVIHGMKDEQDIRKMGGLKDHFPITYVTFLISTIAIAGIFPFSGFFSKDEILYHALMDGNVIYWGMGISGAFITAFYMFRLVFLTFHGPSNVDPHVHPHESPKVMTLPLIILAFLALTGGLLGIPLIHGWHVLHNWLEPVLAFDLEAALHASEVMLAEHGHHTSFAEVLHQAQHTSHNIWLEIALMAFSVLVALAGIVLAWFFYLKRPDLPGKLVKGQWGFDLVENKYYVDETYDETVVKPIIKGSDLLWKQADMRGVDGAVNGVAQTIGFLGKIARSFQSGFVRNYALIMVVGFIFLVIISQIEV